MYSHSTLIWADFPDLPSASRALARLQQLGFRSGQIAVQKSFQRWTGVDWPHALYVRMPEGIVSGFACGVIAAFLLSVFVSKGWPQPLHLAGLIFLGSLGGSILGAFCGLAYAALEPVFRPKEDRDELPSIAIGVQCASTQSQLLVREEMRQFGASMP